jgi:hypothetical protein
MSNCALPTITLPGIKVEKLNSITNISSVKEANREVTEPTTDKLERKFLDTKNSRSFITNKLFSLRMKKRELDDEIFKFYEVYRESRTVKSLELFLEMTGQHLAKLMKEFLEVTKEITELEAQLKNK